MYRSYFGLTQLPFKTTPELEMFYREGSREEILQALKYTVERGDGILKVVGEVGCGKTMILRLLSNSMPESFKLIYVNSPNLSSKDFLLFICSELGIETDDSAQKFTLINQLQKKLLEFHSKGMRVVMLVDEAQSMTLDGLEEVRLLSNLETDSDKLLQIVLFGQPELDVALEHSNIRQLKSRITYSIYIPPFSADDVFSYLNFRMRKSGYSGIDIFTKSVAKRVHKLSGGYPRSINVIADKLLMAVFSQQDKVAKLKHFKELATEQSSTNKKKTYFYASIILMAVITGSYVSLLSVEYFDYNSQSAAISLEKSTIKDDMDKVTVSSDDYTNHESANKVTESSVHSQPDHFAGKDDVSSEVVLQKSPYDKGKIAFSKGIDSVNPELELYKSSRQWVDSLAENGFSIQLATITFGSLKKFQSDLLNSGLAVDDVNFVLDYKQENSNFRIKVYYGQEATYENIKQKLLLLPETFRSSKPFIVSFSIVRKSLDKAVKYLNYGGGSNVS